MNPEAWIFCTKALSKFSLVQSALTWDYWQRLAQLSPSEETYFLPNPDRSHDTAEHVIDRAQAHFLGSGSPRNEHDTQQHYGRYRSIRPRSSRHMPAPE
jgi:hypothetical protein